MGSTPSESDIENSGFKSVRVGQINILNKEWDLERRYKILSEEVKRLDIDVLAVQEVIDPNLLDEVLFNAGMTERAITVPFQRENRHDEFISIYSKYDITDDHETEVAEGCERLLTARVRTEDHVVDVFGAHFTWGGEKEGARLRSAERVDDIAQAIRRAGNKHPILLCGDLNAIDTSSTLRFLHGLEKDSRNGHSTYWTDAFTVAGRECDWATSDQGRNPWGRKTAETVGIRFPSLLPARRIDYILSYGWTYGKKGSPTSFGRFGTPADGASGFASDHYGIYSDILI